MKNVFLMLSICLSSILCLAQSNIGIQWTKTYGGSDRDLGYSIQQTTDGGYIIAGGIESTDGEITGNHGGFDYWVVKTDPSGILQWQKSYGGSDNDIACSIRQTTDGGYIIAGVSASVNGDITGNHGGDDYWVVKTNASGTLEWQKSYGGSAEDVTASLELTSDGGYIMTGYTDSNNGDITSTNGSRDYWVVKISSSGAIQWQKTYGGSDFDMANSVRQSIDGGYIISGYTSSDDGNVTVNHGGDDYWIVKTNASGTIQWQKSYGGSDLDVMPKISLTNDGGYILAGHSYSNDGDVTGNHGQLDYWVVKTDQSGTIQWQKSYGGTNYDKANSIQQSTDGGFIIAGYSSSENGDVTGNHGSSDFWIIHTDPNGAIEWQKSYGGSSEDGANWIQQTAEGGYIIAGSTQSVDGDVAGNHGYFDYWVIKLCISDPVNISISDIAYCYSTTLSASGGFSSYLWNTGATAQTIEVTSGGIYHVTAFNSSGCPSSSEIVVNNPVQPYTGEQICMVTLDEPTGKNVIVIEKTLNVGTDSVHIYRKNNISSQYQLIGSIGIGEAGVFTDNDAIPAQQSYQYKISVKDTCGRESNLSDVHRTVLLQANAGINNEINLFWNAYEGFGYPNFEIYRSNNYGPFILIANVPNNVYTFTDLYPPSGPKKYQVRVAKAIPCNPTKASYSYVTSNIIDFSNVGIDDSKANSFQIYPNPAGDNITINVPANLLGSTYSIADQKGRILISGKITTEISNINISELYDGIYTLKIGELTEKLIKVMTK
jgi:hypothetical protein